VGAERQSSSSAQDAVTHLDMTGMSLSPSTVKDFLWRSFRTAHSNSTRPVDFSVTSTWQQRARRFHVAEEMAENWIITCWRGLSALIILKTACMLSNMIFQVSPFPLIKTILKKQDTGDVDAAPLVCIAFGCCQWTFYGWFAWWATAKAGFLVLVYANFIGALLGVVYVMLYHLHCKSEEWWRKLVIYYRIALTIVLLQVFCLCVWPPQQALLLVGSIASACSLVTAVAPLAGLPRVVKTQCSKTIPLPLILASALSAILWAVCGIKLNDPMIAWPNMVAIAANTILLGFAAYYPQEEKLPHENGPRENHLLCKGMKEGYEANFNTFSKEEDVKEDCWIIADSSGGTF